MIRPSQSQQNIHVEERDRQSSTLPLNEVSAEGLVLCVDGGAHLLRAELRAVYCALKDAKPVSLQARGRYIRASPGQIRQRLADGCPACVSQGPCHVQNIGIDI